MISKNFWPGIILTISGIFIFLSTLAHGQDRKLVKRVKGVVYEEFEVLAADRKVRDGSYLKYRGNVQLGIVILERGFYSAGVKDGVWETYYSIRPYNVLKEKGPMVNGLKQGLWEEYYHMEAPYESYVSMSAGYLSVDLPQSGIQSARGNYEAGIKAGVWEFLYPGGYVYEKYDYTTRQAIPVTGVVVMEAENRARFVGGDNRLERLLSEQAFENAIMQSNGSKSGSVVVQIAIDSTGTASGAVVVESENASKLFLKKALDLVGSVPSEWIPARGDGEPAESVRSIKIRIDYDQVLSNFSSSKISFELL